MSEHRLTKHIKEFDDFLEKSKPDFDKKMRAGVKSNACMSDFKLIKTIGRGGYGRVKLVKHIKTRKAYAMKILEKAHIVKLKNVNRTVDEIQLISCVNFEYVIHLHSFFMDNVYLYLTMPFVNGGDLHTHLRSKYRFTEDLSKFYASQVILALEYLHFLGIVYRDLKPHNLLLGRDGFIMVTDFGMCKKIDNQRTSSFCGTLEYLAPEVLLEKEYDHAVDWWSLGVLIFEMTSGYRPFSVPNRMEVNKNILAGSYETPDHLSEPLRSILKSLLQADCTKRLGNLENGAKDIKAHEWFKNLDWNAVWRKQMIPSFIPRTSSPSDVRNFPDFDEEDLRSSHTEECAEEFKELSKLILKHAENNLSG